MACKIKTDLEERLRFAPALGYVVAINLGGDDMTLYLDGHHQPTHVTNHYDGDIDTTLSLAPEKMQAILDGSLDAGLAVLLGQLKVSGKMGVALKLANYLER